MPDGPTDDGFDPPPRGDPALPPTDAARTGLVAGTASHVGNSTVPPELGRPLARQGVAVAPFKAQNTSKAPGWR